MTTDLARGLGARVSPADVAPSRLRSLEEIAVENAVEGCVRESLGAKQAADVARRLQDTRLGRALSEIAVDERRHGRLAWAIDRWARPRLPEASRGRVDAARAAELQALFSAAPHAASG
jgi:hypothetical protein